MIRGLSIRSRILFFLVPLVISLITVSAYVIAQSHHTKKNATELMRSVDYFVAVSAYIHALQVERGMSALFLNGKVPQSDLGAKRDSTNQLKAQLKPIQLIVDHKSASGLDAVFEEHESLRRYIDGKGQAKESNMRFGAMVGQLIQLQIARAQTYPLEGIENRLVSQSVFETAKESMGRLRAATTAIISANQPISIGEISVLEGHLAGIMANLGSPALSISQESREGLKGIMASTEWRSVIKSLDTIKANSSSGNYGMDPKVFFTTITWVIDRLRDVIVSETSIVSKNAGMMHGSAERAYWLSLIALACVVPGILAFAWWIVQGLLAELMDVSSRLARGSHSMTESAKHLSESSGVLSSGATQQASAIEETVSSLSEIRAMGSRSVEGAESARQSAVHMSQGAGRGKDALAEMRKAIDEIQESNAAIESQFSSNNAELAEITKLISEISIKSQVINDIVFQTKLLSFNASVEAARAGEAGKGFSVVAEEIGNLAHMSGQAAQEIMALINSSVSRVDTIINESRAQIGRLLVTGHEKVQAGTETTGRCDEALNEILRNIDETTRSVSDIKHAISEQTQGVTGISTVMEQLDRVTQSNAASAEKVSSIANQLSEQAGGIESLVHGLAHLMYGKRGAPNPQDRENIVQLSNRRSKPPFATRSAS